MTLNWQQQHNTYTALCPHNQKHHTKAAIGECIEKASALLASNIQDDSLYLLFEWQPITAILTIVVTDSTKSKDAPAIVSCQFAGYTNNGLPSEIADQIQYDIKDYLTTCASFMQYSLVAAFHSQGREHGVLL